MRVNHDTSTYIFYITIYDHIYLQIDGLYLQISNEIMHGRLHIRDFSYFSQRNGALQGMLIITSEVIMFHLAI